MSKGGKDDEKKTKLGFSVPTPPKAVAHEDDDATAPGSAPADLKREVPKTAPPRPAGRTPPPARPKDGGGVIAAPRARPLSPESAQTIRDPSDPALSTPIKRAEAMRVDDETVVTPHPFVEVELVYERGQAGMSTDPWRSLEIWTRNHVYSVDWNMRCTQVLQRDTGAVVPDHSLLNAYLAGGQLQVPDEGMELTYPCPRPGCEAVFEYRGVRTGFVNTSTVTRVVLRLRVLTVPTERLRPAWDTLSGINKVNPNK